MDARDYRFKHNEKSHDGKYLASFVPERGPKACVRHLASLLPAGASVFEYGVGLGANALFLAEAGYAVEAQDVSDAMISRFRDVMREKRVDIPVTDSAAHEHMHARSYQAFVCTYVLHFMSPEDALRVIATIRTHTVAGGYAAFEIFTANSGTYMEPGCYYPKSEDFLALFADWETVMADIWQKEGAQTGRTERLGVLFRKPGIDAGK